MLRTLSVAYQACGRRRRSTDTAQPQPHTTGVLRLRHLAVLGPHATCLRLDPHAAGLTSLITSLTHHLLLLRIFSYALLKDVRTLTKPHYMKCAGTHKHMVTRHRQTRCDQLTRASRCHELNRVELACFTATRWPSSHQREPLASHTRNAQDTHKTPARLAPCAQSHSSPSCHERQTGTGLDSHSATTP